MNAHLLLGMIIGATVVLSSGANAAECDRPRLIIELQIAKARIEVAAVQANKALTTLDHATIAAANAVLKRETAAGNRAAESAIAACAK